MTDENGVISTEGSLRVGQEKGRSGTVKTINYKEALFAFVHGSPDYWHCGLLPNGGAHCRTQRLAFHHFGYVSVSAGLVFYPAPVGTAPPVVGAACVMW